MSPFHWCKCTPTQIRLIYSLPLIQTLPQPDSVHVQTHHPRACGQCHRGVDPWPQRPLVKAEVVLVVGPQALGAILSQDLDGEARCNQALRGLPQLHVEVLPQATQPEVNRFTTAVSVWWAGIWGQGSAPPSALVMGNFVRDVNALVVDLIWRYNLIFWMRETGRQGRKNRLKYKIRRLLGAKWNTEFKCNREHIGREGNKLKGRIYSFDMDILNKYTTLVQHCPSGHIVHAVWAATLVASRTEWKLQPFPFLCKFSLTCIIYFCWQGQERVTRKGRALDNSNTGPSAESESCLT